jgi:class 3 adenylate cyclase
LRLRYLLSIGLVALLILGSMLALHDSVRQHAEAVAAINSAGRQRMLSQVLAKEALRARNAASRESRERSVTRLQATLAAWSHGHARLHEQLSGSSAVFTDPALRQGLARVEAPCRALQAAANELVRRLEGSTDAHSELFTVTVDRVLVEEPGYLQAMDRLVDLYEEATRARFARLTRTALILAISGLLILAAAGLLIMDPAVRRIQHLFRSDRTARDSLQKTFGRYVSDEVMHALLDEPDGLELGGEERKATLLMADLRGYTAVAARLAPQRAVRLLNLYLASMTEVVIAHHGTINEFLGDCVFASFGAPLCAPDDAHRAASCALSMQLRMEQVNQQFEAEDLPRLRIGIAVHTGTVVAGSIGSLQRAKYAVVGAAVNFTSRLEDSAIAGQVLVSESTLRELGDAAEAHIGTPFEVKGVDGAITAYELTGLKGGPKLASDSVAVGLVSLTPGLPVRCRRILNNQVMEPEFEGKIWQLSMSEASIVCTGGPRSSTMTLAPQDEIELSFNPEGLGDFEAWTTPEPLYAKVVEGGGLNLRVWFSAVPPAVDSILRNMVRRLAQLP